jgi:uncharacterized protein (DUF427 family)
MKAKLGDTLLADAGRDDLISIEGNWYFPPSSLRSEHFVESPTPYRCPWKGDCQYFTLQAGDERFEDGAWSYPEPYPTAIERVGRDFSRYVAFDKKVTLVDE